MKIILTFLFMLCGLGMYFVLAELLGIYSLIITIPMAFGIGWTSAVLFNLK